MGYDWISVYQKIRQNQYVVNTRIPYKVLCVLHATVRTCTHRRMVTGNHPLYTCVHMEKLGPGPGMCQLGGDSHSCY